MKSIAIASLIATSLYAWPELSDNPLPATVSIEHKIACIHAGRLLSESDPIVSRTKIVIQNLKKHYIESATEIADSTVVAHNFLKKKGIVESHLSIMENISVIFKQPIPNQKYSEYASAYVALRANGKSPSEATRGLQALIRSIVRKK